MLGVGGCDLAIGRTVLSERRLHPLADETATTKEYQ